MNREELQELLEGSGINRTLYSLYGPAHESESYSLVMESGEWQVLYKERGKFVKLGSYSTEDAACSKVLELFSGIFGARTFIVP